MICFLNILPSCEFMPDDTFDVSPVTASQEALLKAQFFDLSLNLLCILDAEGRVQYANDAFNVTLPEAIAPGERLLFVDLVHPDDAPVVQACLQAIDHPASPRSFACRFRCH